MHGKYATMCVHCAHISLHKSWPVQIFIHFSFFCTLLKNRNLFSFLFCCTIFIGFSLVDCERDRSLRLFARAGLSKYYTQPGELHGYMHLFSLTIKYLSCAISFQWNTKCTPIYWARGDDFIKMDNNHSYSPIGKPKCVHTLLFSMAYRSSFPFGCFFFFGDRVTNFERFFVRMDLKPNPMTQISQTKKRDKVWS